LFYRLAMQLSGWLVLSWCLWRCGTTPTHPELGRETHQRRTYWQGDLLAT
jgi:hypothetical protein